MPDWILYRKQGKLPLERRSVLVMIRAAESEYDGQKQIYPGHAAIVAVGYIRVHSDGPFFVVPGVPHRDEEITHGADCLGDNFDAPHWHCRQVVGSPRRQWNGSRHVRPVTSAERFGA